MPVTMPATMLTTQHAQTTVGRRATLGTALNAKTRETSNITLVRNLKNFKNNTQLKRSAMMAVSFGLDSNQLAILVGNQPTKTNKLRNSEIVKQSNSQTVK
jgi:hypothetical protein